MVFVSRFSRAGADPKSSGNYCAGRVENAKTHAGQAPAQPASVINCGRTLDNRFFIVHLKEWRLACSMKRFQNSFGFAPITPVDAV